MKNIGLIHDPEMDEATWKLIAEKRAAYEQVSAKNADVDAAPVRASATMAPSDTESSGFPPGATLCVKCNTQAVELMDGSQTCLNCGYSKCG